MNRANPYRDRGEFAKMAVFQHRSTTHSKTGDENKGENLHPNLFWTRESIVDLKTNFHSSVVASRQVCSHGL